MNTQTDACPDDVAGPVERPVLQPERGAYGEAWAIPLVDEDTPCAVFENAIRRIGVVFACEWFGHAPDSDFTRETIRVLRKRSGEQTAASAGQVERPV